METKDTFSFEISLSVLNHLGRNLYRNFITVLGEAISNSWDADANNVWIYIDRDSRNFTIKDDGDGMNSDGFQNKFLRVGYSKRKNGGSSSPQNRPYIGAKGIGKLALLSCSEKISIISKTSTTDYVGGVIDNSELTQAIENDLTPDKYALNKMNLDVFREYIQDQKKGTIIHFENIKEEIKNTVPYLRKLVALYFRFSLIDSNFNIFVNDKKVTLEDIKELSEATEFLWNINNLIDPYFETLTRLKNEPIQIVHTLNIKGFIGTVEKPRFLKISGTEEKVGIDLFVNGRLRERDILKHAPDFSTRHIASYLYGQIHFDDLDKDNIDRFTSSREGVVSGDEKYKEFIETFKEDILKQISDKWDELRLERGEDGDDDNPRKSIKERRAGSLYNLATKNYSDSENAKMVSWMKALQPEAEFNIPSYVDCFLSENLLRKHIVDNGSTPITCLNTDLTGGTCGSRNPNDFLNWCQYCKGGRGKENLQELKRLAGTTIQIRSEEDNLLMYLDYIDLAKIVNDKILKDEDKPYKPLRNSVMHTSRLTDEAKTRLTSVFDNIVATVKKLVQ